MNLLLSSFVSGPGLLAVVSNFSKASPTDPEFLAIIMTS